MYGRSKDLLDSIADHLDGIAKALRQLREDDPVDSAICAEDRGGSAPLTYDVTNAIQKAKAVHPLLGSHQELVIDTLARAHPQGRSVPEINPNTSTQPNTYLTCDKLEQLGLVRCDTSTHPKRYFLGQRMLA